MGWREEAAELPDLSPTAFELTPAGTALVIVDMQYVDAHRDHGLGEALRLSHPDVWDYYFSRIEQLVLPNCAQLLEAFRTYGMRVIHLTLGPVLADGADLPELRRPDTAEGMAPLLHHSGTFTAGILPELMPIDGEPVVNKTSRSAFNSTAIDQLLRNLGVTGLIVAGVSTSSCVETTARDAADRGYRVAIVEEATAELDEPSHDATLRQFAVRWGRVWTMAETMTELKRMNDAD